MKETQQHLKPGLYQHYKGDTYQVLSTAYYSEDPSQIFVVYQLLYEPFTHWVRPLSMFTEEVVYEGKKVPRFKYIANNITPTNPIKPK